jgi:hypothetical protein
VEVLGAAFVAVPDSRMHRRSTDRGLFEDNHEQDFDRLRRSSKTALSQSREKERKKEEVPP